MNIAAFAVSRPVAMVMRIVAFVVLGIACATQLPVDLLPKVDLPTITVTTQWPNVAPEEIEIEITRPIEESVSAVENLYAVTSNTREGISQVRVQFNWGTDIGQAALDTIQLVNRAQRNFPTGDPTLTNPIIQKFDPNQLPILTYAVSGIDDPVKLYTVLDNEITPLLEAADGVASATITGGQQRAIIINVDPVKLAAHNLALADVVRRLVQENVNLPAGVARQGDTEYTIRSLGWLDSLDKIRTLPLTAKNGQVVQLQDVADILDANQEQRQFVRMTDHTNQTVQATPSTTPPGGGGGVGVPGASISISKQSAANTISTADAVKKVVDHIENVTYKGKLYFAIASDQSKFIKTSVSDVRDSALIGAILAILVLLFFLRNVRSTLVVALSIPTSILSTFGLLYLCGFTINTMSLSGLALATGLIVDDAVVVLENIFRHIERDKKGAREAAVGGTMEVISAVFASTWTVMVVFLPLLLIQGQAGQMYSQFALVVIFSLAVSLLDATTTVPLLATRLVSGAAHSEDEAGEAVVHTSAMQRMFHRFGEWFNALDRTYRGALNWAIHHRLYTLLGALGVSLLACCLLPFISYEILPPTDSGDLSVNIQMPIGTALSKTDAAMKKVEAIVNADPDVATVLASTGSGGFGGTNQSFAGNISVHLKENRKRSTQAVVNDLQTNLRGIPGVFPRASATDIVSMLLTGGASNVEVDIFGDDLGQLATISKTVMNQMLQIKGMESANVNWQDAMPEIQWSIDRAKATDRGVSFTDVANTISIASDGQQAGYYVENGYEYPIMVQMPPQFYKTVPAMQNLIVNPSSGGTATAVVLGDVAHATIGMGPSQITRLNRRRYVAISASPQGRSIGEVQKDVADMMAKIAPTLPSGYDWDWGVQMKRSAHDLGSIIPAVILALALIYMLLAAQFESFVHPLTVLFSVPLAGVGVILALFLTGRSFGLTAGIGCLMLVGIVVKNGILLVDYTNQLRRRGLSRTDALLAAGPTRLRPILMTASAALLGMLPLALGVSIQAPMATVVIGGLTTSTLLTLLVVPVVYTLFDDLAGRFHRHAPAPTSDPRSLPPAPINEVSG